MKWLNKTSSKYKNLIKSVPEFFIMAKESNISEKEIRQLVVDDIMRLRPQYNNDLEVLTEYFYNFYNQVWEGLRYANR